MSKNLFIIVECILALAIGAAIACCTQSDTSTASVEVDIPAYTADNAVLIVVDETGDIVVSRGSVIVKPSQTWDGDDVAEIATFVNVVRDLASSAPATQFVTWAALEDPQIRVLQHQALTEVKRLCEAGDPI